MQQQKIKSSFFFTGRFYRTLAFKQGISQLVKDKHYLGAHSDEHLLYCDWTNRDSLLVSRRQFRDDLLKNYAEMKEAGIEKESALYFLPPYEWYNDTIAAWTRQMGLQLINFTPGTRSHADYTTPVDRNYRSSEEIYRSIIDFEKNRPAGLNGFILLTHVGTDPKRTDKFYYKLPELIKYLKAKGYQFQTVDKLLLNH